MTDCWDCIHLEKRRGGFQYCLLNRGRINVDANKDRCDFWETLNEGWIETLEFNGICRENCKGTEITSLPKWTPE